MANQKERPPKKGNLTVVKRHEKSSGRLMIKKGNEMAKLKKGKQESKTPWQ